MLGTGTKNSLWWIANTIEGQKVEPGRKKETKLRHDGRRQMSCIQRGGDWRREEQHERVSITKKGGPSYDGHVKYVACQREYGIVDRSQLTSVSMQKGRRGKEKRSRHDGQGEKGCTHHTVPTCPTCILGFFFDAAPSDKVFQIGGASLRLREEIKTVRSSHHERSANFG